ncbi:MAG: SdpI family protein [Lachnospiraceae bacterium]|nr:SdpI family protein [Lachnospiraceae bacterium]
MKKIFSKEMLKTWIVVALAVILAIVGIVIMPDTIPTHFGPSGEPDAWGSKFTVLLYPAILVLVTVLAVPMIKLDPKQVNYERFSKYYYNFFLGFALFFLAIEAANIAIAMGAVINVGSIICFMVGVLMFFVGNMMPKIKQNFFFGIKTPWALTDEENWFKTHRLGGKTFAVGGIAIMIAAFIPGESKIWILLAVVLVMVFVPFVYSYLIFKRKNNAK